MHSYSHSHTHTHTDASLPHPGPVPFVHLPRLLLPPDFKIQVTLCLLGADVNKALPSQDGSLTGFELWGCVCPDAWTQIVPGEVSPLTQKVILLSLGQSCPSLFRTIAAEAQCRPHLQAVTLGHICFKAQKVLTGLTGGAGSSGHSSFWRLENSLARGPARTSDTWGRALPPGPVPRLGPRDAGPVTAPLGQSPLRDASAHETRPLGLPSSERGSPVPTARLRPSRGHRDPHRLKPRVSSHHCLPSRPDVRGSGKVKQRRNLCDGDKKGQPSGLGFCVLLSTPQGKTSSGSRSALLGFSRPHLETVPGLSLPQCLLCKMGRRFTRGGALRAGSALRRPGGALRAGSALRRPGCALRPVVQ